MHRMLLIAVLVLLPASTILAHADDLATARKAIEAQYERLDAATVRKDASPPEGVLDAGLQAVTVEGDELNLRLWASAWEQGLAALETVTVQSMIQSLTVEGDTARAVVHTVLEGTLKETPGKIRMEAQQQDTWVKVSAGWRLKRTVETSRKVLVDGVLAQDFTAVPPMEPARRDAIVSELQARAQPFKTVAPGVGFDDLAAFGEIVGDARIIALGESTHGTAEFFRMKHRLFEYLVETKGFTVFAFEANWPSVEMVDRYVKTGEGTSTAALKAMHEVWQTREVLNLIEWMRAYNSKPGRKRLLSFTGFDMQSSGTAADCVLDAFSKFEASDAKTIEAYYTVRAGEDLAKVKARFADARKLVEARREAMLRYMTAAGYERIHQCAVVVEQQLEAAQADTSMKGYSDVRDKAMALNVKWLAETAFAGERIVLWAHNGHVATTQEADGWVPMGQHLRQMLGKDLRVLGFAFDRGEVLHIPFDIGGSGGPDLGKAIAVKVPPASLTSSEAVLRTAGLPRFVLDLRTVPALGALGTWLAEPQKMRTMGWGGKAIDDTPSAYISTAIYSTWVLQTAFDALVFVEESTATVPLR
jgi:erythromycin esterase